VRPGPGEDVEDQRRHERPDRQRDHQGMEGMAFGAGQQGTIHTAWIPTSTLLTGERVSDAPGRHRPPYTTDALNCSPPAAGSAPLGVDPGRRQVPHLALGDVDPDTAVDTGHGADRDSHLRAVRRRRCYPSDAHPASSRGHGGGIRSMLRLSHPARPVPSSTRPTADPGDAPPARARPTAGNRWAH
jgi:hypothetical protein